MNSITARTVSRRLLPTLSGYDNVSAIHILSHGSEGAIDLGGGTLDSDTLAANADLVRSWGNAFTESGDILIYGCDLAASEAGQSLVNNIASLTGADVAASNDLTGNASLGGDWDLEYRTGNVETAVAVGATAQAEYQAVLDTIQVNTTSATGVGSLDAAITFANSNTNVTTITFNIGGGGPQTIAVAAAGLPMITSPVILDATTQPGYSGTPLITLDGSATGATINGIYLRADNSTVKGFIVHSFGDEGIEMDGTSGFGNNNTIQNNWVGIDATGAAKPNGGDGILITVGASGNQIGGTGPNEGNIIAGNTGNGILIRNAGSDNNIIEGNRIGLSLDGLTK